MWKHCLAAKVKKSIKPMRSLARMKRIQSLFGPSGTTPAQEEEVEIELHQEWEPVALGSEGSH